MLIGLFKKSVFRLSVILLVSLIFSLSSTSVFCDATDNKTYDIHIDTDEYCIKANNVTYVLSEIAQLDSKGLRYSLIDRSAVLIIVRNTEREYDTANIYIDVNPLVGLESGGEYQIKFELPEDKFYIRVTITDDQEETSHTEITETTQAQMFTDVTDKIENTSVRTTNTTSTIADRRTEEVAAIHIESATTSVTDDNMCIKANSAGNVADNHEQGKDDELGVVVKCLIILNGVALFIFAILIVSDIKLLIWCGMKFDIGRRIKEKWLQ